MKRRVAAGALPDLPAAQLLSAGARRRVEELREAGVRVVVLDECHHLLSLWGALLKAVLDLLEPEHVLGLTATNPRELSREQAALYAELLDGEDFSVPTPAVVREGFLAPYQELVQLCTPLASEHEWLAERHARFELVLEQLAAVPAAGEHLGLDVWLLERLSERRAAGGGRLSWAELARRQPRLADAGLRWLHAHGAPPPEGAPRGEQQRAALTIDDWVVLLEDYALRCLRADAGAEAERRLDALQVALGDLGFTMTRQGIRRSGGEVDRVLLNSAAKPLAMCDALACEYDARGPALRAVVMCDSERPPRQPRDSPLTLTGGGRGLLAAAGADDRLIGDPRGARDRRDVRGPAGRRASGGRRAWTRSRPRAAGRASRPGCGPRRPASIVVWRHADAAFGSPLWTAWATRLLAGGETLLVFGTRGLLGEGWDCPPVNVLVDMTAVAADVSVRQMRGRSLRLDPADPQKLASNWDVVCVAPALERGHADYGRFVRRHAHLHAPCEDGTIETGPSHVHPELSPVRPAGRGALRRDQRRAAGASRRTAMPRALRWRIGEPYRGVDLDVLVVRNPRRAARAGARGRAGARCARSAGGGWRGGAPTRRSCRWSGRPARSATRTSRSASCPSRPRARCASPCARRAGCASACPTREVEVSRLVSAALDELFGGGALARYVVSRAVVAGRWPWSRARPAWHAVPADLARRKERAEAFHAAWRRWVGDGELVYCHGADARGRALAVRASASRALETQRGASGGERCRIAAACGPRFDTRRSGGLGFGAEEQLARALGADRQHERRQARAGVASRTAAGRAP